MYFFVWKLTTFIAVDCVLKHFVSLLVKVLHFAINVVPWTAQSDNITLKVIFRNTFPITITRLSTIQAILFLQNTSPIHLFGKYRKFRSALVKENIHLIFTDGACCYCYSFFPRGILMFQWCNDCVGFISFCVFVTCCTILIILCISVSGFAEGFAVEYDSICCALLCD